ncbi:VapE family protein [Pseudomonas aeruginosa]|uniref:VapE domain-containing protein n=1 Tax=Pseudomonas aeruginosa TaxID=287 RepID=UPI00070C057D|nr:VapE domain-containing protein [Pseudomonas aeruginosa]MDI3608142.1 VapE family protein [Pseudomonas aeruginosa]MDI3674893.1 VapE family protein [Pseudomonas aeruginosa]MDI3705435.1 VapE family protein [Pseudomonas aeruginosa]MDI3759527.1 VapE family protein [Pseudomonas aeruginosa]MDI3778277.1 VapE family protein [Pseudomonas aeruginosa]
MSTPNSQFASYMEPVARLLLGTPNIDQSTPDNLRFGSRGSLSVDLKQGVWHDHESGHGGGVLDLIERETGKAGRAAVEWLERQGIHQPANDKESKSTIKPRAKIVAAYDYVSEAGELLFQVCRMDPKDFRQRKPNGSGWSWSVKGVQQVPYRLPQMLEQPDSLVFVVEGEKDADALTAAGLVATCNAGGANKWPNALAPHFAGRHVVILPDNDDAGRSHAAMVAGKLAGVAASVRVLELPGLPQKGDVSDWLDAGHDAAELLAMAENLPPPANDNEAQPLDKPLDAPEAIYHPDQISWKRDKETGEWAFHQAKGTAENLARLVRAYGVRIRYNELSRDVEISVNGKLPAGDLARNVSLSTVEDLCRINEYPYTAAAGHLDRIAAQDAYNPALDWVKSQPWNGGENIRALFDCLTLADKSKAEVSWTLFRKWFLGAAAILSGRARKFEHVLVLVDPMGGIGKTRFFNTLSPKDLQADGITLNPDDKDSVLQVVSKWLVELGEIGATFSKSDIESLKAFLSRDTDELRPAYARAANRYQRRTAFFGSVNNVQFLMDDTNNRRFWPIQVVGVDYQHNIDVQQAWAEALARVEAGETWHLDQDENRAIGEHNEAFRSKDRVEEMILSLYDPAAIRSRYLSASDVLNEIGVQNAKVGDTRKAGTILRKLFTCKVSRGVTVYHMPPAAMEARRLAVVGSDRYADRPF